MSYLHLIYKRIQAVSAKSFYRFSFNCASMLVHMFSFTGYIKDRKKKGYGK